MFRRAVKKAGIDDLRLHDLHHDFATRVRRGGAGLDTIAKLLGHSSLAMANRYAHLGAAELAAAVEGLSIDRRGQANAGMDKTSLAVLPGSRA